MSTDEEQAIKEALNIHIEHKMGNRINITCKTRDDALLLGKWKGIQGSGTYTQNPLPECFTHITWNSTQE